MLAPRKLVSLLFAPLVLATAAGCMSPTSEDGDGDSDGEEFGKAYEQPLSTCQNHKGPDSSSSGITPPDDGPFYKHVALTFDDGPNLATTPKVLNILADYGIKATFFINGTHVDDLGSSADKAKAKALLKKMIEAGHILGNHKEFHTPSTEQSVEAFRQEVIETGNVIKAVRKQVLADGDTLPDSKFFFRFPYGDADCSHKLAAQQLGYHVVGWHVDSADWCFAADNDGSCSYSTFKYVNDKYRSDFVGLVMSQIEGLRGGIVLMHDAKPWITKVAPGTSKTYLELVLDRLKAHGYKFALIKNADLFPEMNAPLK